MSLFDALVRGGALRPIDRALAQTLRRLELREDGAATPDLVLAGAALASLAVSQGHAAFDPARPHGLIGNDATMSRIDWPSADDWSAALATSRWVSTPDRDASAAADAPLVLEQGLLYLRRYRQYEFRLAQGLRRLAVQAPGSADHLQALAPLLATLFPATPDKTPDAGASADDQARAAALALLHRLLLITGGPGTGKTTTIARVLLLLIAQARQADASTPRIALAAPTGRAAERMAEGLRKTLAQLHDDAGIEPDLFDALPTTASTLHRLLGSIPDSPRFRHHADNPLPFDVVVVDEASMVDLPLMCKLVEAVADGARLILLGDPDQLPSVEAGDVLSGILRAAGPGTGLDPEDTEALRPLLGDLSGRHPHENTSPVHGRGRAKGAGEGALFPARRIHLQRSWRQHEALQLAPLANAVREGDSATALSLLRSGTLSNIHFHEALADPLQTHGDHLLAHWRALADADSPVAALALASRLRLLTAVREGPQGARTLNARIETLLAHGASGGLAPGSAATQHFHGRLLLITENSQRHQLFNGDIGICLRDRDGGVMTWFPGDTADAPRAFHPATLPAHDSAFAMTVHKAQGSEFDEVWLLLPARDSRVLSRELLYTAITRARRELHVAGSAEVIEAALARHASRWSGLGWRLSE